MLNIIYYIIINYKIFLTCLSVVGAVVATAVGLALISILIFCFIRNRRKNPSLSETSDTSKDPYVSTTIRANCFNQTISAFPFTKKDIQIGSKITHFLVKYFDYNELEKATENFHPSKELGNGGFGTVYYGMSNSYYFINCLLTVTQEISIFIRCT